MKFNPIAIVGQACVLPGALTPEALWRLVIEGSDQLSSVPADRWGISPERILTSDPNASSDRAWSDVGGYVRGFEDVFDSSGFSISADAPSTPGTITTRTSIFETWLPRCRIRL